MAANNKTIYTALAANLLIAVIKFISGAATNSSAMISEGVHSVVDTTNQFLLLFGIRRSKRSPDERRPFGYGKEVYFWSFIVSILIFGVGGCISFYQGVIHIKHPPVLEDPTWNYIVLACSLLFEGTSLVVAIREFDKVRGEQSWWKAIHRSKDPASFIVLFEDSAAVTGLIVVAIMVYLGHHYNNPYLDGAASLIVGIILSIVSVLLARESHSLLMGEGIAPATQQHIRSIVEKDPAIVKVQHQFSTYQSPEEVMLLLLVTFRDDLDTEDINEAITRIRKMIREVYPLIHFIIIQPEKADR
ncbi:cation diffusion facilitator family transporter [Chitinophaga ginsengisoli]|uniref:Cation diffusion facilitator family transporter n=1 Tax=Chitinophaga ginsengisoli TaxID=363837 RepID=A0A2P8FLF8_9BACT|nr:cation diffusion facilitator family transporter [Chitinophaga ginsengisoli]PSL22550.1 cation diffusion facilitator family transporter [Chitinophaga ginsengisoli]